MNYDLLVLSLPGSPRRAAIADRLRAAHRVVDGVLAPARRTEWDDFVRDWCRSHDISAPKGARAWWRGGLGCKLAWIQLLWQAARDCNGLVVGLEDDVAVHTNIDLATWDPRPYAVAGRMRSLFPAVGYATYGLLFHVADARRWLNEQATGWLSQRSAIDLVWWRSGLIEPWKGPPDWIVNHLYEPIDPCNSERIQLNGRLAWLTHVLRGRAPWRMPK